jgi:hypothetical protein
MSGDSIPGDDFHQGYLVYPETLRTAANTVQNAADLVQQFADTDLAHTALGPNDLGLPGTTTVMMPGLSGLGTVDRYNQALKAIGDISHANVTKLQNLSRALQTAAAYYEQLDEDAYDRMKKIEGDMK